MGIEASYRRIPHSDWGKILDRAEQDDDLYESAFEDAYRELADSDEMMLSDRYLSIEKEWHAIHAMLTGDLSPFGDLSHPMEDNSFPPPLGNVIFGGTEIPVESTYGNVRYLTPSEVEEVAQALQAISAYELKSRFDPVDFTKAEIYPNPRPGGWDEDEIEASLYHYPMLVDFFAAAAREGDVVILSFD